MKTIAFFTLPEGLMPFYNINCLLSTVIFTPLLKKRMLVWISGLVFGFTLILFFLGMPQIHNVPTSGLEIGLGVTLY